MMRSWRMRGRRRNPHARHLEVRPECVEFVGRGSRGSRSPAWVGSGSGSGWAWCWWSTYRSFRPGPGSPVAHASSLLPVTATRGTSQAPLQAPLRVHRQHLAIAVRRAEGGTPAAGASVRLETRSPSRAPASRVSRTGHGRADGGATAARRRSDGPREPCPDHRDARPGGRRRHVRVRPANADPRVPSGLGHSLFGLQLFVDAVDRTPGVRPVIGLSTSPARPPLRTRCRGT